MNKTIMIITLCFLGAALYAQTEITGIWNTGKDNTLVKIYEKDGVYLGEVVSSDNPKAEIGKQIIKDLKNKGGKWKGKLYAAKKKKWFNAKMDLEDDNLKITVKSGLFKKTIEWKKVESNKE
jgi:uncharacterized protein (DUF2147 family)